MLVQPRFLFLSLFISECSLYRFAFFSSLYCGRFVVYSFFLRVYISSCFDGLSSVSETPVGGLARDQLLD